MSQINLGAWPQVCEPAIVPDTLPANSEWDIDISGRGLHLFKFWFMADFAVIPGTVLQADQGWYWSGTVEIFLSGPNAGYARGVQARYVQ
jgi:hypothetical protein